jgi:rhodanese-related sulfurtransferase
MNQEINEICPTTTFEKVGEGVTLVDVREPDEVAKLKFNVPNVIYVPMSEFERGYVAIPKDKEIVLVCSAGQRSLLAAGFLLKHGYEHGKVSSMEFGMTRWVERGFPTTGDATDVNKTEKKCCG